MLVWRALQMGQVAAGMWLLLLLWGICVPQGCSAQFWASSWRWLETPRAPNRAELAVVQPYVPLSRALPPTSPAVRVECKPDRMVVTVHRDLLGVGKLVTPADLTLGMASCPPVSFDSPADVVVFEAGLHECGSVLQMTPDLLIYRTSLFYKPSLGVNQVIVRTNAAEIPIECRYPRKENVTSKAIKPTWAPFRSTVLAEARLEFLLRLMSEDWSGDRTSTSFHLGDILHLQAEVYAENHLPLRLFVDSCVARLSPESTSVPQYAIIDSHGCLVDGEQDGVSSTFVSPRPRLEVLRFTVDAFKFAGDSGNLIYILCHLKVTPADHAPDALNKACSYNSASNVWLPVEGSRDACSCCQMRNCGRMLRGEPQRFHPQQQPLEDWQRRESADGTTHQAWLALGPLFIVDSQDGFRQLPGGQKGGEEMVLEELIPVIESEAEVTGMQLLLKEQEGSARFLEDQILEPVKLQGAYVGGGPSSVSEAEAGSGLRKDQGEQAMPALFSGEVVSRPSEEATSSTGKLAVEAVNMAVKGQEQQAWLGLTLVMAGVAAAFLALGIFILVKRRRCQPCSSTHPIL